ncbi:MAG: hypothetical protein ACK4YP_12840 [Myxococcota bacterium]
MRLVALALLAPACVIGGSSASVMGVDGAFCDAAADGALEAGWAADLDAVGCGWHLRAVDRSGTLLLTFDVPAFAAALDGAPASASYALPDDAVRLTLDNGCLLGEGLCGGLDEGTPSVSYTYSPTAGAVDVTVAEDGTATVVFTGVALANGEGDTTTLDGTFTVTLEAEPE